MPRHWLFKTEPSAFSIERLREDGTTPWSGVRSFQARNNMTEMRLGDLGLFYHSSIAEPAAMGICKVVKTAYPDFTQFERGGEYFDDERDVDHHPDRLVGPGATADELPFWVACDGAALAGSASIFHHEEAGSRSVCSCAHRIAAAASARR